ncbi:MAG: alkaline phosphatase D family protein [Polyangiaceae bacterium]|nr:alkaline phosphatase D family protein [Polyangiaceae bacterium]
MMKRRIFLQATLATAGATLAGCDGETESTTGTTSTTTPRTLEDGSQYFPQSVASGDPKPDSVILWTRVEDAAAQGDLTVELEVGTNAEFSEMIALNGKSSMEVTAQAAFDHCVKVRLADITAGTVYYYRFIYEKGGKYYVSKVGRTKTAPSPETDTPIKFAYVSCQDYIGRYYNTLVKMAREPLDFFVHLGDYVYETTGDPTFQNTTGRKVEFSDQAGALELTAGSGEKYYAAKSLSNYRELYKIYRSDSAIQKVHESFPMIATWDDHEFSDDCHGAVASYFDGKKDETDVERRKAADQAWFEYMPVDYLGAPDFAYDASKDFPGDIKIWRDFQFGKNVHLVMTDLRTRRADHIIPEEAYPGTVVLDEDAVKALNGGEIPAIARPYVDINDAAYAAHKAVLEAAVMAGGGDKAKVTGNISVLYLNSVVTAAGSPAPIDEATQATLPRGVAYVDAGKLSLFTSIGARYFTVQPAFDLLATAAYQADAANQHVMGSEQETWFLNTMKSSAATWKVWGNEFCLIPLMIDLTTQAIPDQFKQKFYMNVDSWDGFRDRRSALISELSALKNVVAITGDIHASYTGVPSVNGDPTKRIVEFVGSSVSSGTFKSLLQSQVAADPVLSGIPGAGALAGAIDTLLMGGVNPHLAFADSGRNGYVVVDVSAAEFVTTYIRIAEKEVGTDHYADADSDLDALFKVETFKTVAGANDLYQKQDDGKFLKWNTDTQMFE